MYENLEQAITHKRFVPTPRQFPSVRLQEHYAVEPWEKNTFEIQIREDPPSRQAKTFYHTPLMKKHQKQYTTHRGFSFWNNQPNKSLGKPKSLAEVSRKSVVNPYNISGNILGDGFSSQRSMPFQLPNKRIKSFRGKEKSVHKNEDDRDPIPVRETVTAMKRRISLQRQRQPKGFVQFNMQNQEQIPVVEINRKKSKVISLGFQKITVNKTFVKQRSLQLAVQGVVL